MIINKDVPANCWKYTQKKLDATIIYDNMIADLINSINYVGLVCTTINYFWESLE